MRPVPQVGENLPIVVKPDHLRRGDPPGRPAAHLRPVVEQAAAWPDVPTFIVLTQLDRTVNIPVRKVGFDGRTLHIYAEIEP